MHTDSGEEQDHSATDISSAWAQVAATVIAVDATLGKWLADNYGIGLTEYRAALHLSKASDRELRITELAHRVGLNQSSATRLVGRMENKGLAYRDTCPDDGRGVYAVITDKGRTAVAEIREAYEVQLQELVGSASRQFPELDLAGLGRAFQNIGTVAG